MMKMGKNELVTRLIIKQKLLFLFAQHIRVSLYVYTCMLFLYGSVI